MQKKWKIMIILLTILIILYALTSCKEKIQEKKGNEDNWKVYQQLEEKEEQNIQNPFIREETKCILTEKEKQELRNQLLKIVTQCKDIYHPIIDQTTGYQSISREEVKKIKKRFGENGLVCVAENMNMENYEKVEEFYLDYLEDRETDVTIYEVNNDGSFCSETFIYRNKVLLTADFVQNHPVLFVQNQPIFLSARDFFQIPGGHFSTILSGVLIHMQL